MKFLNFLMILLAFSAAPAAAADKNPVVLEFFTSPYCGDTPPADAVFADMVRDFGGEIIALSCAVTFMNPDRGDMETMLQVPCNQRHMAYIGAGISANMNIPMTVINGIFESNGTRDSILRSGIVMGKAISEIKPLGISLQGGNLAIAFPENAPPGAWDVWVFGYNEKETITTLATEEVPARDVVYARNAHFIRKAGSWDGRSKGMTVPLENVKADGYAVLIQDPRTMEIIAAGEARL